MNNREQSLIEDLVNQLEPNRSWSSFYRALGWFTFLCVFNILAFLAYQNFRPGFSSQLLTHPRFLVEIISASALTLLILYGILSDIVPGKSLSPVIKGVGVFLLLTLVYSLYLSFYNPTPEVSIVGARAFCLEEVVMYGLLGLFSCFYFVRKSDYPFTRRSYLLIGMGTTLIPAVLMQLACMYSPKHALLIHYGPILVGLIFGFFLSLFSKTRD